MKNDMTIKKVGLDSLEGALALLQRFFYEEGFRTGPEGVRSSLEVMLTDPNCAVFIAQWGLEVLGVATVTMSVGIEYGRSAEMDDLYVLPQVRESGIASELIEAVCEWSHQNGCTVLLVTVTPEGEKAHGLMDFYQRRGFSDKGRVILERALPNYPLDSTHKCNRLIKEYLKR